MNNGNRGRLHPPFGTAAPGNVRRGRACFRPRRTINYRVLELGLVAAIVVFTVTVARPYAYGDTYETRETQVRANLHTIQVEVERYGVDHAGGYPRYLIGGERRAAAKVDTAGSDTGAFTKIADCPSLGDVADPLLADGYLAAYPPNPFTRNAVAIHMVQGNLPSAEIGKCDPLRNATADGARFGTRFGAHCDLMGSVLADPRYRRLDNGTRTFADIQYDFWDVWIGSPPLPYLPGEFFYKCEGSAHAWDSQRPDVILPAKIDMYIMGAYGGIRTKGKDVLGDEQPVPVQLRPAAGGTNQQAAGGVWNMTRSEVSNDLSRRGGSSYSFSNNAAGEKVLAYGNPNGIRDGLILLLTAGE